MDQELQKLIGQLRSEKCPPRVLEAVAQRIAGERSSARVFRPALAWGLAVACVLSTVLAWQWHTRRSEARLSAELARSAQHPDRALVVQQAQEAFGYIGEALLRAASQTESALSKEAVPPLRSSFEIIKNKVTKPI